MAWARGMGTGNMESTPLVYDGVMYAPGPADYIQAIDAKTGDLLWENRRKLPQGVRGGTNRNIAIWGTTIIDASADNQMYAIDAQTGKLVWETPVLDPKKRASASSGPIIANGKVITGRQCQPEAGNDACIVTAHDAKTGKELWRTRTIPLPGEPGYDTWGDVPMNERWHVGTWMVPSYDPETNLIFVGTSVTIPAPKFTLGGNDKKHLYHNSTLAIERRHRQDRVVLPARRRSLGPRSSVRAAAGRDGRLAGPARSAVDQPAHQAGRAPQGDHRHPRQDGAGLHARSATGEFLWARPTVMQNVITRHRRRHRQGDRQSRGAVHEDRRREADLPERGNGGKNWPAGAYNPHTQRDVLPAAEHVHEGEDDHRHARPVEGLRPQHAAGDRRGHRQGRQPCGRSRPRPAGRCGSTSSAPAMMSLVATAGGLVFGGDANGRFRAFDDRTGKVLWEQNLGSPVSGFPVTFAVDGKQYVAVTTGPSLVANSALRLTPELKPSNTGQLYVFALP